MWRGFCDLAVSCRLRKLDPEEEEDPFHGYDVPSEAKLESCPSTGPQRLPLDAATFMESGRRPPWSLLVGIFLLFPGAGSGFLLGEWSWCLKWDQGAAWAGLGPELRGQLGGLSMLSRDSASACRTRASGHTQGGLCRQSSRPRS